MGGRAVLLVGSARPRGESTSEALGAHLMARLAEGGVDTETFFVSRCRRPEKERLLQEAAPTCACSRLPSTWTPSRTW